MIIAASLKQLLDKYKIAYRVLQHKRVSNIETAATLLNIDLKHVLTVQVLADHAGVVLVVYPVGRKLDFAQCPQLLKRNLQPLPAIKINRIFNDCEADSWPAVGQPYNIEIILDKTLKYLDQVYFASGSHTAMLQMQTADYLVLNARAKILAITSAQDAQPPAELVAIEAATMFDNLTFPSLPPIAMQILQLAMSKDHSAKELVDLFAQDPVLQQQIMIYTQLPFTQTKLLGFDMVSHIALGVAAGRAVDSEREDFWRHAFYAATYAERISELVAHKLDLDPAISYMAGLFHNFGLLLISQLFAPEYSLLKKWIASNPKVSIAVLEQRLLGMGQAFNIIRGGHAHLGEWLLRSWQMPEAICVITKEHHSLTYKGKYAHYVNIIQLTNQLLRAEGVGDGTMDGISEQLLEPLGLTMLQIMECIAPIKVGTASLEEVVYCASRMSWS